MSTLSESSFWILSSLASGPRHGYGILQDVEALSHGATVIKTPTLYATLDRMQHLGQIAQAGEEIVDGRARRYYSLTDAGREALESEVSRLQAKARVAAARLRATRGASTAVAPA